MKKAKIIYSAFLLLLFIMSCNKTEEKQVLKLWYKQAASEWMQAAPIGNGRLGVMIYGGVESETLALNEVTMWSGQYDENQEVACGKEKLAEMRNLFFQGKLLEGNKMAEKYLSGKPHSFGTHLPVGDVKIDFTYKNSQITDYERTLNIENALSTVDFKAGGVNYKREYFCSNPDNIFATKYTSDEKGGLNFNISLNLLREAEISVTDDEIIFSGQASLPRHGPGGVNFYGKIKVQLTGGKIIKKDNSLAIENADEALIWTDIRTDYKSPEFKEICDKTIAQVSSKDYESVKNAHIQDYSRLFNRVELYLGKSDADKRPTDVRWKNIRDGKKDIGMDALFFQFGRYLLIASSRENSPLPANLQGIWNDNLACNMPWTCDYHLDMNTQQNYWAANICNLAECNTPLFNYVEDLSVWGEKTAKKVYGSPGWVAHSVANVWGYTAPGEYITWGAFPTGGVWIGTHLWEHYLYTQDVDFLRNKAYPIFKKSAIFFQDYLVEHPINGYMMSGPSNSPENSFMFEGKDIALSMMTTCDLILLRELYTACIQSAKILGVDSEFSQSLEKTMQKFPPFKIGKNGEIQEWFEDYESAHPNHRHSSHILSLYPYNQITLDKTPELTNAALLVIENKLSSENWEDVEFCRAMMIAFYARLKQADKAYESLTILQNKLMRENLFTMSVAGIAGADEDIFLLDGNEGASAAIAEMLIQNHQGYIEFLPSLPSEWNTGHFKGLCVKGGAEVDLNWEKGLVKQVKITASSDNIFPVKIPNNLASKKMLLNGKVIEPENNNGIIKVSLKKGETFEIVS